MFKQHGKTCWGVHHQRQVDGGTQYKRPYGDVPPTWVAKSASWYINDPLWNAKLVYEWVIFLKLKKIFGRWFCSKFGPKLDQLIYVWMGHFFLKNWYLYESIFKFHGSTSLLKSNLSNPPPPPGKWDFASHESWCQPIKLTYTKPWGLGKYVIEWEGITTSCYNKQMQLSYNTHRIPESLNDSLSDFPFGITRKLNTFFTLELWWILPWLHDLKHHASVSHWKYPHGSDVS